MEKKTVYTFTARELKGMLADHLGLKPSNVRVVVYGLVKITDDQKIIDIVEELE